MAINLSKKSVLVIDDFPNMRATLRQMLQTIGFDDIAMAARASEALEMMRRRRYDIVLCDYNMGDGMDGQQLLDVVRAEGCVGPATIFIMVTAESTSEMVMGAIETMPDAYLSKPFNKEILRARIERISRRKACLEPVDSALRDGDIAGAITVIDRLLAEGRDASGAANSNHVRSQPSDLLRLKADLALKNGEHKETVAACEEALVAKPHAWALTMLGHVAVQRGDLRKAEELYRKSIATTPAFMAAHDGLAALKEELGETDEAFSTIFDAAERSPKSLMRQLTLARLAETTGRADVAERAWRKAISIGRQTGQNRPAWHASLVAALAQRSERRLAQATIKGMEQEFADDPELPWWLATARIRLLTADADSPSRLRILDELGGLVADAQPPADATAQLTVALTALGEREMVARLRGAVR